MTTGDEHTIHTHIVFHYSIIFTNIPRGTIGYPQVEVCIRKVTLLYVQCICIGNIYLLIPHHSLMEQQ